jgi:hypothetical protein
VQGETWCKCGIPGSTSDSRLIVRPREILLLRLRDWTVGSGSAGGLDGGPGCLNDAARTDNRSSSFERAAGTEDSSSSLERATRTEDSSSSLERATRTEDSSSSLKRATRAEDSSSSLKRAAGTDDSTRSLERALRTRNLGRSWGRVGRMLIGLLRRVLTLPGRGAAYLQFLGLTIILLGSLLRSISAEWLK